MGDAAVLTGTGTELRRAVDLLTEGIDDDQLLGAQIAVLVGGQPVLDEAIGARDVAGTPLSPTDRVPWFCASKALSGVAALRLLHRESVPSTTPVGEILPGLSADGRKAVQVRHLLDHTAGFPFIRGPHGPPCRDYDFVLRQGYDDMLQACLQTPLEPGWVPGRDGGYHIMSATYVLSAVMEQVGGRPYEELVDELVLRPIGATEVTYGRGTAPAWSAPDAVMPHRRLWDGRPHELVLLREGTLGDCPALGAVGPVSALARLLDDLRAGARAGDPVALAATRRSWSGPDRTFGTVMEYGLGTQVNLRRLGYGAALPAETFGHGGWDSLVGIAVPELDLTLGLFLNGGHPTGTAPRHPTIAAPVIDAVVEATKGGTA